MQDRQVVFLSDLHLGVDARLTSKERETRVCRWLLSMAEQMSHLYLVGDVFDYWYEWREVIPAGHSRWWATLLALQDREVQIEVHVGNHDLWQYRYLQTEYGITVHRAPQSVRHHGFDVLIAHGDGLGPGDRGYKLLKKVMTNPIAQWLLSRLHPNFTMAMMRRLSQKSREHGPDDAQWLGAEREWLVQYAERQLSREHYDFFVFGHRHLPVDYTLSNDQSRYINLGDWLHYETYAILDQDGMRLESHREKKPEVYG